MYALVPAHLIFSPVFLHPSDVFAAVTQILGHITGSLSPLQLRFGPCVFIARKLQSLLASSVHFDLRLPSSGGPSSRFVLPERAVHTV